MDRRATTSGLIQLWIYLSCLSSCWAQMNAEQLLATCTGLNPLQAVIGTENSVSITCNHGAGGLISLDWFLITVGGPVDGTGISIDGVKYRGASPSIEINNILASDEGLYRCSYVLQPNAMMPDITTEGESEGQCLYVLARAQYQRCDPPSSTPCQEPITASPGSVTFNTNVEYVDGGSLGQIQLTRRLQLYRGDRRLSEELLYSCNNGDNQQIPCTDSLAGTVVPGDTQNKYDFSVQVQLDESDSGVYTVFIDVVDPIANSDNALSKTFDVTITAPTTTTDPDPTSTPTVVVPTSVPVSPGSDNSTTVVAVVVPLSIILVALLVIAVLGVAFIAVKHSGTRSSAYEMKGLNGDLPEKSRPESIIEEHYLPDDHTSVDANV